MRSILGTQTKDNFYIVFPTIAGFLFLGLYLFLLDYLQLGYWPTGLILILLFAVFFDVNHFFGSYLRVCIDKHYYQANKHWFVPSFVFIVVGCIAIYWLFSQSDHNYKGQLFLVFFRRFFLVLGFYHLIKQNWGFMAIYKRYANETKVRINWELIALVSGGFIALTLFSIQTPLWFPYSERELFYPQPSQKAFILNFWHELVYWSVAAAFLFAVIFLSSKRPQIAEPAKSLVYYCLLVAAIISSMLHFGVNETLVAALFFLVVVFTVSITQAVRYQLTQKMLNTRKWLLFVSTLALYFGVLLYPMEGDAFIKVAAITLPHNIQYIAFVPYFSRKQYEKSQHNHGLAKVIVSKFWSFLLVGLCFAVVFEMGRTGSSYWLPRDWHLAHNLIAMFFISLVLHHYYLDAVIWKFNSSKELKKNL